MQIASVPDTGKSQITSVPDTGQSILTVLWFFFKLQANATALKATINQKQCESRSHCTNTFGSCFKKIPYFIISILTPGVPDTGESFTNLNNSVKNGSWEHQDQEELWVEQKPTSLISCYSPFKQCSVAANAYTEHQLLNSSKPTMNQPPGKKDYIKHSCLHRFDLVSSILYTVPKTQPIHDIGMYYVPVASCSREEVLWNKFVRFPHPHPSLIGSAKFEAFMYTAKTNP